GVGSDRDRKRGDALFVKSCKRGFGEGCNAHGIRLRDALLEGRDGAHDAEHDADWAAVLTFFRRGCDAGSAKACHNAAALAVDNRGGDASAADAQALERRGCELETDGSATSCLVYGEALAHGDGVDQDEVLAGKWLAR